MTFSFPLDSVTYADLLKSYEYWTERGLAGLDSWASSDRNRSVSVEWLGPDAIRYTIQAWQREGVRGTMWIRVKEGQVQIEKGSQPVFAFPAKGKVPVIPDLDSPLVSSKDELNSILLEFGLIFGLDFDGVLDHCDA